MKDFKLVRFVVASFVLLLIASSTSIAQSVTEKDRLVRELLDNAAVSDKNGEHREAIEYYTRAIAADPNNVDACTAYLGSGDANFALQYYRAALQTTTYFSRSLTYFSRSFPPTKLSGKQGGRMIPFLLETRE